MGARVIAAIKTSVDIRRGERLLAGLMFAHLFFVVASFAVVKPVRSSLFLESFGARNLPYIYLATAVLAGVTAWLHSKLLDRFSLFTVQIGTYLFFIGNLVIFRFAFRSEDPWVSAAFFLWVNIYTVTINTLFWMLANHYYHSREAKRLYGFINAGGTLGGVAAGLALSAIVGDVGTENMLLVSAALLGLSMGLAYWIWKLGRDRFGAETSPEAAGADRRNTEPDPSPSPWQLLFRSRYATLIAIGLGLSLVISTLIDYQFNVMVERAYSGKDERTALFSGLLGGVNAISFVLQFFVTSQLLRRLGVGVAVLLLPAMLFSGSLWMAVWPSLWGVVLLKVTDGSVRYSIEQSSRDMLYLPIPNDVMLKLKALIDVFVQRLAKGSASLLILALTVWWARELRVLLLVSLGVTAAWAITGLLLRREYRQQLRRFLQRESAPEGKKLVRVLDRAVSRELLKALHLGEEERAQSVSPLPTGGRIQEFEDSLGRVVRTGPPRMQAAALHVLAQRGDSHLVEEAEELLRSPEETVKEEAIHYLCAGSHEEPMRKLRSFLTASEPRFRAAALACAANCGGNQEKNMVADEFREALAHRDGRDAASREVLAMALRHIEHSSQLQMYLLPLLNDLQSEVLRQALVTAAYIRRRELIPALVERLSDSEFRELANQALRAYGHAALGALRDHLQDASISVEARHHLPAIFAHAGTKSAARDLVSCLPVKEREVRFEIIRALNRLKDEHPDLDLDRSILAATLDKELRRAQRLLHRGHGRSHGLGAGKDTPEALRLVAEYQTSVETVFRLLGLLFEQQEMRAAFLGIKSHRPAVKASAIELLETSLPSRWARRVLPLVDDDSAPTVRAPARPAPELVPQGIGAFQSA